MAETKTNKKETKKTEKSSFSVIKTGGKQYIARSGETLKIEAIKGQKEGDKVTFDQVLMTAEGDNFKVGTPLVSGAKVEGEIIQYALDKKVAVIKYKAKSNYFKKKGHRQPFMKVLIK